MSDRPSSMLPGPWFDHPLTDFRREMDRAIESFFGNRSLMAPGDFHPPVSPSIDIVENDKAIVLTAELPGLSDNDIDLTIHNGVLQIKGEKKMEKTDDKDNVHLVERRYGAFRRTLRVPPNVDEAGASARFDKGVLTVTLPKTLNVAPAERKIAIEKQ